MSRMWMCPMPTGPELVLTHVTSRLPADIRFPKKVDLLSCDTQSVNGVGQKFSLENKLAFCGDKIRVQFFTDAILPKKTWCGSKSVRNAPIFDLQKNPKKTPISGRRFPKRYCKVSKVTGEKQRHQRAKETSQSGYLSLHVWESRMSKSELSFDPVDRRHNRFWPVILSKRTHTRTFGCDQPAAGTTPRVTTDLGSSFLGVSLIISSVWQR